MIDLIPILNKKAKKKEVNILLNEGWDERVLWVTQEVLKEGLAKITLMGNEKETKEKITIRKLYNTMCKNVRCCQVWEN